MKDKSIILIVDDYLLNIKLLEAYLLPCGYELVKAASGEEALAKLAGNQIDLILLDVMMPDIDGFEVTRRIRQDDKIACFQLFWLLHYGKPRIVLKELRLVVMILYQSQLTKRSFWLGYGLC